jgi:hypothetical protein
MVVNSGKGYLNLRVVILLVDLITERATQCLRCRQGTQCGHTGQTGIQLHWSRTAQDFNFKPMNCLFQSFPLNIFGPQSIGVTKAMKVKSWVKGDLCI